MDRYEIQVLDPWNNRDLCGRNGGRDLRRVAAPGQSRRKPGEWNVYDLVFKAPVFDGAKL